MLRRALSLLLASSIPVWAQSAADYYVRSIPGQPDGPLLKMHAGHIEVDAETNGHLFFWHFHNRHIANRQRTILWLNGGPGCSSMDGALMEIGPYRVQDDHTLVYNNGSWDEFANLLFVDQPVGTGFSYVNTNSFLHDLDHVASHMITFLEKWFALFPEYESDDFYIAGESYAGQYIPHVARAILERNKNINRQPGDLKKPWALKGLMIGNGWISPKDQYPAVLQYAYAQGLVQEGSTVGKELDALDTACAERLADPGGQDIVNIGRCEMVLERFLDLTRVSDQECVNYYDVRLKDASCGVKWPPDLDQMTRYLQRTEVRSALNLDREKTSGWTECNNKVTSNLQMTNPGTPSIQFLPHLIESGVKVLLFSGDQDLICNHLGTEQMIHNMKWNGGTGFETAPGVWAPRRDWTFEGDAAGYYQQARNLTYVLFYNASHMVPFDWPRRTRDMADRFINVNISDIGGTPADSRLDGEKLPQTSVGNSTSSSSDSNKQEDEAKIKDAEWKAYAKSGEAALLVVIIGVSVWGFLIWRARQRDARQDLSPRKNGYRSVSLGRNNNDSSSDGSILLGRFRTQPNTNGRSRDLEARDFDEAELDSLTPENERDQYVIGEEDGEEDEDISNVARPRIP